MEEKKKAIVTILEQKQIFNYIFRPELKKKTNVMEDYKIGITI